VGIYNVYSMFLLLSEALQLPHDVPAYAGFLCNKIVLLVETRKERPCIKQALSSQDVSYFTLKTE
jgi:hypothetical protein